ncbi:IQ motif, EF-hand binding site [Dillenia turbinata]|uniref:IQ motif, EF-hand binding site n=1 Tax=Dillenia turbinata TaxID=194707 RepID=A0AAN8ZA00_9MAGN
MNINDQKPCPTSPSPPRNPNFSVLRDLSNFKTPKPKHPSSVNSNPNPNFPPSTPQFFTASKHTPSSSSSTFLRKTRRSSLAPSLSKSKAAAARRLKAFELEQSQSSRKAQIKKEKSFKALSNSLTSWLNFLFHSPSSCGCVKSGFDDGEGIRASMNGKRVGIERPWRNTKRQRDLMWQSDGDDVVFPNSMFSALRNSLSDVCSFNDLTQRMRSYLSLAGCKEVFTMMTQVTKNIDEGRLKMKPHCPLVTDVGEKEKTFKILLSYNPVWLRIGLYIIFGGDSLVPDGSIDSDQDITFLKMIIEKQFFSHAGLAKVYAYNKLVEGLYRPGYFENLGNVILKRFLLLVLILDKAKSQSALPIMHGIDGTDGGSPLLFILNSKIKSSRQMIRDFLSTEVMHGEGNLLAHLVIIGYKVSYEQSPLIEYNFRVKDLFEDLQDGVRLCRAIQLLQHESSLITKIVVPSDTHKKNLMNCGIAIQYLKKAGVPLTDEDGTVIVAEDVANGDKELTLSLLWNIFVHLQMPLLTNEKLLLKEISKIRGVDENYFGGKASTPINMILKWVQVICEVYQFEFEILSSLANGKAMWCLLEYYFMKELRCPYFCKDYNGTTDEESTLSAIGYADPIYSFILLQKLAMSVGNFPEVLQISDVLENNGPCNERCVLILLAFLSSQIIVRKNMDLRNYHKLLGCNCQSPERRYSIMEHSSMHGNQEADGHRVEDAFTKFKTIQAWWQDMAKMNWKTHVKPTDIAIKLLSTSKSGTPIQRDNAAKIIQSHFRRSIERSIYLKKKRAVSILQSIVRAWLTVKHKSAFIRFGTSCGQDFQCERWKQTEFAGRHTSFMVDRHGYVKLKKSVLLIQHATRRWIAQKHQNKWGIHQKLCTLDMVNAAIVVQKYFRGWTERNKFHSRINHNGNASQMFEEKEVDCQMQAAAKIQHAWKKFIDRKSFCHKRCAAIKIQSHYHGGFLRQRFLRQKEAVIKIQQGFRSFLFRRDFQQYKLESRSAIKIQCLARGWAARREACRQRYLIVLIQSHCRGWLTRRLLLIQRVAVIKIQNAFRCLKNQKEFHAYRHAAVEIQRFVRGQIVRGRLLGASSCCAAAIHSHNFQASVDDLPSFELLIVMHSVLKLQFWWRSVLQRKLRSNSAVIIQCHVWGWIVRQKVSRDNQRAAVVQAYWKGYLVRNETRGQLLDLRLRMQKSAINVDEGMRIINRLLRALSELLSMKSVSNILHTCATLDMATEHSQKCCEELVAAGAIGTLLKLIRSVSRSIPDQEVLKHALSTLRNLARYSHLADVLIDTHGSVDTILWEFLRNKDDGYFIASELLKRICLKGKGVEAVCKFPPLLKRLHNLVEDLRRKANNERRSIRAVAVKENTERRLREAVELLYLITNG